MHRSHAIRIILKQLTEELVVINLGDPSKEAYHIKDRNKNFYMLGSLGLASSISLGLALSQERKVLCLDGDGSLLMNLGSLATIANQCPNNLVLVVLDNGVYGTTGNQESYTSGVTNLRQIASACGFKVCYEARDEKELTEYTKKSLTENVLTFIHVIIEPDSTKKSFVPIDPVTIKKRFMNAIALTNSY